MSYYGDYTSTSHQQAYPPAERNTYQHPPPTRFTSQYGPPPPVPASLHHASYAATPPHQQRQYLDIYEHAGPSRSNRGRGYLKSLGSGMAALNIEPPPQRTHLPAVPPVPLNGRLSLAPRSGSDKPLPRLPPPPPLPPQLSVPPLLPARPATEMLDAYPTLAPASPGRVQPVSQPVKPLDPYTPTTRHSKPVQTVSPPKSFKPSPYLHLPLPPSTPPSRHRPHSAPDPGSGSGKGKGRGNTQEIIDLTLDSPSSPTVSTPSSPSRPRAHVTPQSPARLRRRGASDQPPHSTSTPTHTPLRLHEKAQICGTPSSTGKSQNQGSPSSTAVRCAGYTRAGERCKRTVKVEAPYLAAWDLNVGSGMAGVSGKNKGKADAGDVSEQRRQNGALLGDSASPDEADDEVEGGRYCKDHAGMICGVEGFYSRDKPGLWIRFDDWVPPALGQQTKALLRTTMESRLTAKETPGFIYAYELRDLQTPTTSLFKVGRTDNVARRMGEWANQCQSKTPTLRDIFPLSQSRLSSLAPLLLPSTSRLPSTTNAKTPPRAGTLNRSFLPGLISSGHLSSSTPPNPSVKRWEKLVHLELADIASRERGQEWEEAGVRGRCGDCGKVHREVFAVPRDPPSGGSDPYSGVGGGGEGSYQVVLEVVNRWERFTSMSAPDVGTAE